MAYNLPNLPFGDISNRTRGGMRRQGPVDRFDESVGERSRGRRIPPELLQLLMAQLMAGQGGGAQRRPPMGGGGRPPVVKIEDLVRALSGGGAQRQAPQANMPVPQARR